MLTVTDKNFDWANIPLYDCIRGNALDAHYTLRIYHILLEKIRELGNLKLMEKNLVPLASIFSEVEWRGMDVNLDMIDVVGSAILEKIDRAESSIRIEQGLPEEANLKSTDDLKEILYSSDHLGLYPAGVTDTGNPSTDKETLKTMLGFIEDELEKRVR